MATRRMLLQIVGTAGLVTAAGVSPAHAGTRARPVDAGALQAQLDGIAATSAAGVLAEVQDSTCPAWTGAAGVARLDTRQPMPAAGRFRAGSITKSLIATVVLQLAGEGRLTLDDTVQQWLPGRNPDGARITVRHLLQHTSGIPNCTETAAFSADYGEAADLVRMRNRTWTPNELLALVDNLPLRFEPGTDWWYSNTNYILLGLLIERVTGAHYAAEIHRRVLRPLGMRHTRLPGADPAIHGPHPHGYLAMPEPVDITVFNPSVAGASGELVSTAADLNAFYRALLGGRLLRPAERRELLVARPTPRGYDYGLGLMTIVLPGGTRLWGHRGDFFGYHAQSWTTTDGRRQLTIALTPWGPSRPKVAIEALLHTVFE